MAYREELTLKARGLHKYADTLETVPEGSLQEAVNVVLDKNDIITPRRGFEALPGTITGSIGSLHTYTDADQNNTLIAHRNGTTLARYDDGAETWTDYTGTFSVPASSEVIRSVESNKNFYFATSKGVQKLDAPTATPLESGAPEALDIQIQSSANLGGDPIAAQTTVAYRAIWGYKDLNDNLILGAPSKRVIFENTGGSTLTPTIRAYIPVGFVDESWFIQLYRTEGIANGGSSGVDPGDITQLALERNPSAGDITNGYIDLADSTPDELLGAELYTNSTQEGIIAANYQPPQSVDMALFQNHMFYANTETRYEFNFAFLDTLSNGDTITINGVVYTGQASENPGSNQFQATGHSGTPSQQIEATARSLTRVINDVASSNSTLWAVYSSEENELPGKVRIYERDYGDAGAFGVSSSVGSEFSPNLDPSKSQAATNNKNPNRLFYSKFQEPEAVPLLNFFDVGPANDRILRILPLRSTLLVFTTRAIYRLSGTTANTFQVTLLDNTARLLAPESLVPINNTACGLFDQGVSRVSSSAVQVISRPIEGDLLDIRGATGDKLAELSFGVSYESDRKYLLAMPETSTATINNVFYVYNTVTNSWTTFDLQKSAGIVRPDDDKLYFAEPGAISRERKNFNETDYAEEAIPVVVTSVAPDNVTLTLTDVSTVEIGYMFLEDNLAYSVVEAIDTANSTITVKDPLSWNTGTSSVLPFIQTTILWNPLYAKTPNVLKQFSECTLLVETPLQDAELEFSTPNSGGFEGVEITDTAVGPWGLFPWDDVAWGGEPSKKRYRTYVPRTKQKDTLLNVRLEQNTVYNQFQISGLSLYYRFISNRVGR